MVKGSTCSSFKRQNALLRLQARLMARAYFGSPPSKPAVKGI